MAEVVRISRSFKDISLSFQPHPVTGDLPVLKNERAINKSVQNIVQTQLGERFFQPNYGSDVRGQLFALIDFGTASEIQDQILTSLENFEPRIESIQVEVEPLPDTNEFNVTVIYDIIGQEFPRQTYSFVLEATR